MIPPVFQALQKLSTSV